VSKQAAQEAFLRLGVRVPREVTLARRPLDRLQVGFQPRVVITSRCMRASLRAKAIRRSSSDSAQNVLFAVLCESRRRLFRPSAAIVGPSGGARSNGSAHRVALHCASTASELG
jgi:hypothetical protein